MMARVPSNTVYPLWIGVSIPATQAQGTYSGNVTIPLAHESGLDKQRVDLSVIVSGNPVPRGGDDNISSGSRLMWVDSTLGLDPNVIPSPFTPIRVASHSAEGGATFQVSDYL